MVESQPAVLTDGNAGNERRFFLIRLSSALMAFGLAAGYGMFATLLGRFLYPARAAERTWQFVATLPGIQRGTSLTYTSPAGQKVVITRIGEEGTVEDFIALSSVCPHLGCQVHWELQNERFFCPCHNGAFDALGNPTAGPPKDAGQELTRFPLKITNELLFIQVSLQLLVQEMKETSSRQA